MILVVDDSVSTCDDLSKAIRRFGFETLSAYSAQDALHILNETTEDVSFIVSDVHMPEISGIELLEKINQEKGAPPLILMSGVNDVIDSINAIEIGAIDFIPKPIDIRKLIELIKQELQNNCAPQIDSSVNQQLLKEIDEKEYIDLDDYLHVGVSYFCQPMGNVGVFSEKMLGIYKKIQKLHDYPEIPILIEGKTGTGKEVVAKFIHYDGPNKNEPFVALNCSTISKEMFEAELFGYEKGAYTGASSSGHDGFMARAGKGTLFLDEFTEVKPDVQAKLLRVLQEGEYYKLGGNKPQKNMARIVCATNSCSETSVQKGSLREDLYYRLSVCKVELPELYQRLEEVLPLTLMFISEFNRKFKKGITKISSRALRNILSHRWEGNIRELENTLMKSILFIEGDTLEANNILYDGLNPEQVQNEDISDFSVSFRLPEQPFDLNQLNMDIVKETIEKFNGNKSKAADFLGLTRSQMYNKYRIE